jgi:hypothetical protein
MSVLFSDDGVFMPDHDGTIMGSGFLINRTPDNRRPQYVDKKTISSASVGGLAPSRAAAKHQDASLDVGKKNNVAAYFSGNGLVKDQLVKVPYSLKKKKKENRNNIKLVF